MKILAALLATETNTFSSVPTGARAFAEYGPYRGDASKRDPQGGGAFMAGLGSMVREDGHEFVESLSAFAQPLGRTVRSVYEGFRDEILADIGRAMPLDAVFLMLHGAMAADGYDDCEGDVIEHVRALVGPHVVIGVELDLHCHFTARMQRHADLIVSYKEYPHIDALERARELYKLMTDTVSGRVKPTTATFDCRMVGIWHTTSEPMKGFVERMKDAEGKDGVLSVSLGHGFPWGDLPEAGAKLWVITDNDLPAAQAVAERLGWEFWNMREQATAQSLPLDRAIDQALAHDRYPVVVADVADNPGGGAPGDSTFILRRLLDRRVERVAIGGFWDPSAVQVCLDAGVGSHMELRLGGKSGPSSGDPVDLRVTVMATLENHSQLWFGARTPLGPSAWVRTEGLVDIVLVSVRSQTFDPHVFTGLGIELQHHRLVVVKSTQHFHAQFAPLTSLVLYASTPGAICPEFAKIPYRRRDLNYWPRVANPHAAAST